MAGTSTQYVADDYAFRMYKAFNTSRPEFTKDIAKIVKKMANIDIKDGALRQCREFMMNDTVVDCPIEQDKTSKEFLVVVHSQQTQQRRHLLRILLPTSNYRAFLWNQLKSEFIAVEADIFEQKHFDKKGGAFSDSVMYLPTDNLTTDEIVIVKLLKTESSQETNRAMINPAT